MPGSIYRTVNVDFSDLPLCVGDRARAMLAGLRSSPPVLAADFSTRFQFTVCRSREDLEVLRESFGLLRSRVGRGCDPATSTSYTQIGSRGRACSRPRCTIVTRAFRIPERTRERKKREGEREIDERETEHATAPLRRYSACR